MKNDSWIIDGTKTSLLRILFQNEMKTVIANTFTCCVIVERCSEIYKYDVQAYVNLDGKKSVRNFPATTTPDFIHLTSKKGQHEGRQIIEAPDQ